MGIFELSALVMAMLGLAAMPSSSVALVVAKSISSGRRGGAYTALGIVAGDLVFVGIALLGMSALAQWLGAFFTVVKYCAGAYLIWLGIGLLRAKSPAVARTTPSNDRPSLVADFLAGLGLTLGDVKAIFFYASFFPAVVDIATIGVTEVVLIALVTVVTVGGVKIGYVFLASEIAGRVQSRAISGVSQKLGGALMIGCGSALVVKG